MLDESIRRKQRIKQIYISIVQTALTVEMYQTKQKIPLNVNKETLRNNCTILIFIFSLRWF